MHNSFIRFVPSPDRNRLVLIGGAWLALSAPLVRLGYGSDGDAWRIAWATHRMWDEHRYVKSRSTGFPMFELMEMVPIQVGGWLASNIVVLLFGVLLVAGFHRVLKAHGARHVALSTAMLAMAPIVVKNSGSTMDYVPALALLVWSMVFVLENRIVVASVLVGLSAGMRPTMGLFIIPLAILALTRGKSLRQCAVAGLVATLVGVLAFLPSLLVYGLPNPYPSIRLDAATIALRGGYNALRVFGIAQTLALVVIAVVALRQAVAARREIPRVIWLPHVVNVLLWVTLFIALSDEPEYLLPALPSIVVLLDRLASRSQMILATAVVLSYHVVQFDLLGGESGQRKIEPSVRWGMTVVDVQDRRFRLAIRDVATEHTSRTPTLLFFGEPYITSANPSWIADSDVGVMRQRSGKLFVSEPIIDIDELARLHRKGLRLVVWKGEKWAFERAHPAWREHVDVIDDLEGFFGRRLKGTPINAR